MYTIGEMAETWGQKNKNDPVFWRFLIGWELFTANARESPQMTSNAWPEAEGRGNRGFHFQLRFLHFLPLLPYFRAVRRWVSQRISGLLGWVARRD